MQEYDVLEQLGHGSFGKVNKVRRRWDSKELACKEVNYKNLNDNEKKQIVSEVNILRELQHPYIVRYYDRIIDKAKSRLYIVMEFCAKKDLAAYIKDQDRKPIAEDIIWKFLAQIASALKYCHLHVEGTTVKPILHRDIKPANILLDSNYNVKIADFGLAKELATAKACAQTNVGTPYYMSPELINGKSYDERSDIWSLGCVLYELVCHQSPYHSATGTMDLMRKINSGSVASIPKVYSNDLSKAIKDCMTIDYTRRPRIGDILKITVPSFTKHLAIVSKTVQDFRVSIAMEDKQKEFKEKENEVTIREAALVKRESEVQKKEQILIQKESELQAREAQLNVREANVKKQESNLKEKSMQPIPSSAFIVPPPRPTTVAPTARAQAPVGFQIYSDDHDTIGMMIDESPPAANTRRRSLTRDQQYQGPSVPPPPPVAGLAVTDVTDGVKRAKELLNRPAVTTATAPLPLPVHNKENQFEMGIPPPPPVACNGNAPVCGSGQVQVMGIHPALRKRPMTGVPINPVVNNAQNIANQQQARMMDESPTKKQRYTGAPLNLKAHEALKVPASFSFLSNQYQQQIRVQPSTAPTVVGVAGMPAVSGAPPVMRNQIPMRAATALL